MKPFNMKKPVSSCGKALVTSLTALSLSVSLSAPVFASSVLYYDGYAQLATGHQMSRWAASFAQQAQARGLIHEDFPLDFRESITREHFATLLVLVYERHTEKTAPVASIPFTDTENVYIRKAYGLGIVSGYDDGTFDPNGLVTREEAAIMVRSTMELFTDLLLTPDVSIEYLLNSPIVPEALKAYMIQMLYYMEQSPDADNVLPEEYYAHPSLFLEAIYRLMLNNNTYKYKDDSTISSWAKEAIYFNYAMTLMTGDEEGNFRPQDNIDIQSSFVLALKLLGV